LAEDAVEQVVDLPQPLGPMMPRISPSSHIEADAIDRRDAAKALLEFTTSSTRVTKRPRRRGAASAPRAAEAASARRPRSQRSTMPRMPVGE
jgi:hypothetical protein